jgi:hypothetical protein
MTNDAAVLDCGEEAVYTGGIGAVRCHALIEP